ncbi:hypothetical protein F5Y16DRAFT_415673 [Xylariaceae sp. FL0255]|nr:hypothetical protein F5Y16DRAFT_415673 [Xylariaceae sp. FL0255]
MDQAHSAKTNSSGSPRSSFSEDTLFIEKGIIGSPRATRRTWRSRTLPSLCWASLAILWATSLICVWKATAMSIRAQYSWEVGLETDLGPLKPYLKLERKTFSGDLDWDANGTLVRTDANDPVQYAGPPSPEIDENWRKILEYDEVDLAGDEASTVAHRTYQKPGGWSMVGVDMFHQLHCLNMMREAIYPDYYQHVDKGASYQAHLEHCINNLRQVLMCHGDITGIPVKYYPERHRVKSMFEVTHVCRNFELIQKFSKERDTHQHPLY